MTIHRDEGEIQLECDNPECKKTFDVYPAAEFKDMMKDAKKEGWITFPKDEKWMNYCDWTCS